MQEAAQASPPVLTFMQQLSPAGHVVVPPSLARHAVASQTPAPVQATEHAGPLFCQAPLAVQDWGCRLPPQRICPGAHTPVHVPLTQVWLVHAAPTTHAPDASHVSGSLLPVQPVAPTAHTPVHTPLTHVEPVHAAPLLRQVPPEQLCGCWPLHCS